MLTLVRKLSTSESLTLLFNKFPNRTSLRFYPKHDSRTIKERPSNCSFPKPRLSKSLGEADCWNRAFPTPPRATEYGRHCRPEPLHQGQDYPGAARNLSCWRWHCAASSHLMTSRQTSHIMSYTIMCSKGFRPSSNSAVPHSHQSHA